MEDKTIAPRKNDATEAQVHFIERLLAQCEIDKDPVELLESWAIKPRRRKGCLSKGEASTVISRLKIQTRHVRVDGEPWSVEKVNAWCENNWSQKSIEGLVASERHGLGSFLKTWASNQTNPSVWGKALAETPASSTSAQVYGVYSEYREAWSQDRKAQAAALAAKENNTPVEKPATPPVLRDIPIGVHVVVGYADDEPYTLFRVKKSQTTGRIYALQFNRPAPHSGLKGSWGYVNTEPLSELSSLTTLDFETAKEYGDLYGACLRCDRDLTDELSVQRGIGPICFGNMVDAGAPQTRGTNPSA